jgi:hypothetical protein
MAEINGYYGGKNRSSGKSAADPSEITPGTGHSGVAG